MQLQLRIISHLEHSVIDFLLPCHERSGSFFVHTGAVLEILLSSFQAAYLLRMHTVGSLRRVSSDATTQILRKSPIFLRGDQKKKKRSSLHFLTLELKQRPVNIAILPAVYAS